MGILAINIDIFGIESINMKRKILINIEKGNVSKIKKKNYVDVKNC